MYYTQSELESIEGRDEKKEEMDFETPENSFATLLAWISRRSSGVVFVQYQEVT